MSNRESSFKTQRSEIKSLYIVDVSRRHMVLKYLRYPQNIGYYSHIH